MATTTITSSSSRAMLKRKPMAPEPELPLDDDPSFLPVSSPATKIRRLDAEVMPVDAAAAAAAANEERAIVVYKPQADAARELLPPDPYARPPALPFRVAPDWIHGLRNNMWNEASHGWIPEHDLARDKDTSLAMVPWAPAGTSRTEEVMEADDSAEGAPMEVEDSRGLAPSDGDRVDGLPQWPQHCMVPQQVPAVSQATPVSWSW